MLTMTGYRLPREMINRIDAYAKRLAAEAPPGLVITKSEAVRVLLTSALDAAESKR